jgi:hypothetical protein
MTWRDFLMTAGAVLACGLLWAGIAAILSDRTAAPAAGFFAGAGGMALALAFLRR